MRLLQIRYLLMIAIIAVASVACNDSNSTDPGTEPATIEGRVEEDDSNNQNKTSSPVIQNTSVEGATVTAARVTADGSMETISNAEATTNAQGEFTLNINADAVANSSQHVIVMAQKEGRRWKAFVNGKLESGASVIVQPLTTESSGEAEVYSEIIARGDANMVSKADIEAYIDSKTSAEIQSNSEAASTIAAALVAEAEARSTYFANQSIEITEEQQDNILQAKTEALAKLESELHATTSETQRRMAVETYMQTVAHAYIDAGVDASTYAKAKELSGRILMKKCSSVSSEARSGIRTNTALLTSYAIDAAVQAKMEAANASEHSIQAASEAAVKLRSDIRVVSEASGSKIEAAFETYNQTIVDIMQQEFSANAEAIADINSEINGVGGAKAVLKATVEASASTDVIVEAYSTFYTAVKVVVDSTFSSATNTEAGFVTEIMILINLAN